MRASRRAEAQSPPSLSAAPRSCSRRRVAVGTAMLACTGRASSYDACASPACNHPELMVAGDASSRGRRAQALGASVRMGPAASPRRRSCKMACPVARGRTAKPVVEAVLSSSRAARRQKRAGGRPRDTLGAVTWPARHVMWPALVLARGIVHDACLSPMGCIWRGIA